MGKVVTLFLAVANAYKFKPGGRHVMSSDYERTVKRGRDTVSTLEIPTALSTGRSGVLRLCSRHRLLACRYIPRGKASAR